MENIIKSKEDLNIANLLHLKEALNVSCEEFFKSCAKDVMNNICISNGAYIYHPIEIEFYVYDKKNHEDIHVYPREASAGELFFHLSGMDICFKSSIKDGQFGGILIRALEREKKSDEPSKFIGGPLICKDEVLNNATNLGEIKVISRELQPNYKSFKDPTKRKGINEDTSTHIVDTFWDKKYRFIREDIQSPIRRIDDKYNFGTNSIESIDRKYYL